ncbi:MAG: hypothetical protein GY845_12065 [Planctomycetes bacterium]|nr:hypothetical protein [Planctomycetota bacterium]
MPGTKLLTKKQLDVIEDLFAGELDEQAILDKYKLSRKIFNQWRNDDTFAEQFEKRITDSYRQSDVLIARYAPVAAAKLIQLTESDKPETARKACLDIISMPILTANRKAQPSEESQPADTQPPVSINPETAGKLLAVLAEENTINKL